MATSSRIDSVAMNVTANVNASPRLVRRRLRIIAKSIRPHATMNNTAAIDAMGMNAASGFTNTRINSNANAENTAAKGVRAPAAQFAPGRLNDPDVGELDGNAPAILAGPCPPHY